MAKPTHNYITLYTPGTKKFSICARRVGPRDRMSVIAVCTDESNAEKIVDGLNMLQGEIAKLEVPAQRVLEEVRARLASAEATNRAQATKVRDLEGQIRELKHRETQIARDLASQTVRANRAEDALAAQKGPLEKV